jgi:hypothetical protein
MMTPLLARFLADADRLKETVRFQTLDRLDRYAQGTQYEHRELDASGYRKASPGVYGSQVRTPPWDQRDPGAVWNVIEEIVEELTNWTVSGNSWCNLKIADDPEAEDWLGEVVKLANMSDVVAEARSYGGQQGAAIVSFAFRDGECFLEAHSPKNCWVLSWRDRLRHRPSAVVSVYQGENQLARSERDLPLVARYWDEQVEALYQRTWNEQKQGWVWEEIDTVTHGFGFCPVYWHPQRTRNGSHEGRPDGGDITDECDDINILCAAASLTTVRNAEDTLVVKESPQNNPGHVRKGGHNVIFATGGAEYLTQSGESASICETLAEKRAQRLYRKAGVVMADLETLGKATTGEALKRLFQRTITTAGKLRNNYAKGLIVPLCQGLLAAARLLLGRGMALSVPPRVVKREEHGDMEIHQRTPGRSSFVVCEWPDPFPATITDLKAMIDAAVAGTGQKQVLSRRSAVTWLKMSSLPVSNLEEELQQIEEDSEAAAKTQAKALGLGQPEEGKAGPVEDKDEKEEDTPESGKGEDTDLPPDKEGEEGRAA